MLDFGKILNDFSNSNLNLPLSKYHLKKAAKKRFEKCYYVFCEKCGDLVFHHEQCRKCGVVTKKKKTNYFIHISIEQQIQRQLQ